MEARHYRLNLNNKILSRKTTFYNINIYDNIKNRLYYRNKNRPNIPVRAIKLIIVYPAYTACTPRSDCAGKLRYHPHPPAAALCLPDSAASVSPPRPASARHRDGSTVRKPGTF